MPPVQIPVPLIGQTPPQPKPISFLLQKHDVPSVHPHHIVQQAETPDKHVVQIHQFGGLTLLEWMTGQVVAGGAGAGGAGGNQAVDIVDRAQELLRECTARQVTVEPDVDEDDVEPGIVVVGEEAA